jgi:hypothetical protein
VRADIPPLPLDSRRPGLFVALRNAAVFLLGLAATCAAITAILPFPNVGNLWRKYQHLTQHKSDYSLIYIGSSRVFHEFIPQQFDAELAGRGHRVRAFNFGQDGMWPPESLYMLRQILKTRPPNLKWVLIDLMAVKGEIDGNETSRRAVYWHDLRHTLIGCQHVIQVDMEHQRTAAEKAALCWKHLSLFVQQATSLGRGEEMLETRLKLKPEKKAEKIDDEGFEPGGRGPLKGSMLTQFNDLVRKLKTSRARVMHPVMREALEDIISEVRAAGAEPIFVVAATMYGAERFRDWPPERVTVLRFDDPEAYPELYDPARRYDVHHLDPIGAKSFTRRLAEQFADVLERKP